jgi:hypothetical protein
LTINDLRAAAAPRRKSLIFNDLRNAACVVAGHYKKNTKIFRKPQKKY